MTLPHHCVQKLDSYTTKMRVVFNASDKYASGTSLNDTLFIGSKLQKDIAKVLLSFRLHKIVFTGDIKQMYRQILINREQQRYQRIFWRFSSSGLLKSTHFIPLPMELLLLPFLPYVVYSNWRKRASTVTPLSRKFFVKMFMLMILLAVVIH